MWQPGSQHAAKVMNITEDRNTITNVQERIVVSIQILDAKCPSLATLLFPNSFANYNIMVNDDRAFSGTTCSTADTMSYTISKNSGRQSSLEKF